MSIGLSHTVGPIDRCPYEDRSELELSHTLLDDGVCPAHDSG